MVVSIVSPFSIIPGLDGVPLDGAFVYIGAANTNPLTQGNRLNLFSDAAMTVPLTNPFRTRGGFPVSNTGALCNVYCATDFSMTVCDSDNSALYTLPSYGFRIFSDAITFSTLIVGTSIVPDAAGGAFNGSVALAWSNTVSRTMQARTITLYGTTQPTQAADLGRLSQLMMPLLAVNQTSATATAAFVNLLNMDAATVRTATGAYTVVPKVALPSVNLRVSITSMDDATIGFRSVMARIVSVNAIAVNVFIPDTVTAVDGKWSLGIDGNPGIADPIS